jgi:hypothetical protein
MSEETEDQTPEAEATPATDTAPKTEPQSRQIRAEVAGRLKSIGSTVHNNVVEALYNKEADRRTAAVLKCVEEIEGKEKELNKLFPDVVTYEDEEGKVPTKRYSKERVEQRKKLKEEIGKLNGKLNLALEKNDWSKLLG